MPGADLANNKTYEGLPCQSDGAEMFALAISVVGLRRVALSQRVPLMADGM
ncbi:hypothetical protein J2R80_001958 [Bradyrhizobium sp. USDA 4541]|nr:hypothetical protein [Bradyrhizobium sp. USDA 4541]